MIFTTNIAKAQDTLPKFSAVIRPGNNVVVSWTNPFETLVQVVVQRSYDSLKRFTSVYSATSPELPTGGFSEKIPYGQKFYYRIFYAFNSGAYFFTKSKTPGVGNFATNITINSKDEKRNKVSEVVKETIKIPLRKIYIKVADSLYTTVIDGAFNKLKDSILRNTKDTLFSLGPDTILIKQYIQPYVFKPSQYVFTDKDGYLTIKLSDAATKHYEVNITEEDGSSVLELKNIKDPFLIVDKTNFYHGGWYKFILLENGKEKERGRFLLEREF